MFTHVLSTSSVPASAPGPNFMVESTLHTLHFPPGITSCNLLSPFKLKLQSNSDNMSPSTWNGKINGVSGKTVHPLLRERGSLPPWAALLARSAPHVQQSHILRMQVGETRESGTFWGGPRKASETSQNGAFPSAFYRPLKRCGGTCVWTTDFKEERAGRKLEQKRGLWPSQESLHGLLFFQHLEIWT